MKRALFVVAVVLNVAQTAFNLWAAARITELDAKLALKQARIDEDRHKLKNIVLEIGYLRDEVALLYSNLGVRRVMDAGK
jgi:hypothetical protein